MNTTIKLSLIALILATIVGGAIYIKNDGKLGVNAFDSTVWTQSTTHTAGLIGGTSSQLLATTTDGFKRIYARICNDSSSKIYITMNLDKPVTVAGGVITSGLPIAANSCFDITDQNLYQGAVQASSTVSSSAISTIDVQL